MAQKDPSDGVESPVHHEPLVSETLKEGAERSQQRAERAERETARERLVEEDEPLKRHGDALESGTGNRHGVHEGDRRPNDDQ